MLKTVETPSLNRNDLIAAANLAGRAIPPVWPLASSVAVNPFLGQSDEPLAMTAARLERVAGVAVTMPRDWYHARLSSGAITNDDLAAALAATEAGSPYTVTNLSKAAQSPRSEQTAVPTVASLAADASGTDWPGLIAERFGSWAAGYFDVGQALWSAPKGKSAYASWRAFAMHDVSVEIAGLRGFAAIVHDSPEVAAASIELAVQRLGLKQDALETYFHQLLMDLGGWGQCARYRLWQAELGGGEDGTLIDLLAIRLLWETALYDVYEKQIAERWYDARAAHGVPLAPSNDHVIDALLQSATEHAAQRTMIATIEDDQPAAHTDRPKLQAAFCIDVRSEVFRRALEATDPGIETLGFAGFFGLATAHHGFASDVEELRLPALLNPGVSSCSGGAKDAEADTSTRLSARAERAWGRFKFAAVSSFAFVEAAGPLYALELVRDSLGLTAKSAPNDPAPRLDPELDLDARIGAAETVLRAMSLTREFARIILIAGHGANVTNNPHASALHCGACGGYSGEVNARLLALLLNDKEVRQGLVDKGLVIPEDTLFVAGLHDTTTDAVTLYDADCPSPEHSADLKSVRAWLKTAGQVARGERALRLPLASSGDDVIQRSRNWAEVRPEWGLAGCQAFIAAPRHRTAGKSFEGRAFLHNYDWAQDDGSSVLELIMTAPVVVASWISLQYYGSSVAPDAFGAGNKLLHNVTGGLGVVEGNGGVLRAGLPWQSVHDGDGLVHEPLRLTIFIAAPVEAMTDILRKHDNVRALFDNQWLHLMAIDADGQVSARYCGDLNWQTTVTEGKVAA
ncbi:MAG: DUF2309 domain-containing protein [Pseudomonadota bacterium]